MVALVAHTYNIKAWKQQQKDFFKSDANYGLHSEFQGSQGYINSCLKKKKKSHCTFSSHTYAWISPYCFYMILPCTKSLLHKVNLLTDLLDLTLLFASTLAKVSSKTTSKSCP